MQNINIEKVKHTAILTCIFAVWIRKNTEQVYLQCITVSTISNSIQIRHTTSLLWGHSQIMLCYACAFSLGVFEGRLGQH